MRELEAENDRLRRVVVLAVKKYATGGGFARPPTQHWIEIPGSDRRFSEYDGTDAGLIEAVIKAIEEEAMTR